MSQRAQPSETAVERTAQRDTYENVDLNRGSFYDTSDRVRVSSAFDFINQTHAAIIIKVMRGLGMRKDTSRRNISGKKKYHVAWPDIRNDRTQLCYPHIECKKSVLQAG